MGWHREDDSTRRALRTQTRYHNVLTYVPCAICGEKFQLDLATVTLCEGERELGSVCPTCVKAGPAGAAGGHSSMLTAFANGPTSMTAWPRRCSSSSSG